MHRRPFPLLALALVALGAPVTLAQSKQPNYKTRYYLLYTDISRERAMEAALRITRMAEEYNHRTRGFAGKITDRLPFYLFSNPRDYYTNGGLPGSAGMFDGERLMAIAGTQSSSEMWRLIQHEGFHQFAHTVIRGNFPTWVDEGLAEYFGEAVFTGDGYEVGLIPPSRLARLQHWMDQGNTISIRRMMEMPHELWNAQLSIVNYDQAWSMIYFLAHAENGKYQNALNGFIKDTARGTSWERAWTNHFGSGTGAFERKWRAYWSAMSPDPTAEQYAAATVAKITSFYARAFSKRQIFMDFDEFLAAARAGNLKADEDDWLPPGLLTEALSELDHAGQWRIRKLPGRYEIVCTRPGGNELVGHFKISKGRVKAGSITVTGATNHP